jgi:hypothetical protein
VNDAIILCRAHFEGEDFAEDSGRRALPSGPSSSSSGTLTSCGCKVFGLQANFYEKALFVKPTWRLLVRDRVQRLPTPSALCFYPHFL